MGKTRDLFKKIGDTKGTRKDGHNKGQKGPKKGKDLKKRKRLRRGGKNTQKNYTKSLTDLDNHNGVITHQSQTSWSVKSSGP